MRVRINVNPEVAKEMAEEAEEEGAPEITYKKSGSMIWIGTDAAIKAAK